jgi:hypothetical protein
VIGLSVSTGPYKEDGIQTFSFSLLEAALGVSLSGTLVT